VTMTTVWYGDIYPITPMWKIVGSIIIFLGPALVAIVSSITILIFMDVAEVQRKVNNILRTWIICPICWNDNPPSANYCTKCWSKVKSIEREEKKIDINLM
jgi:ribosomal protein L40E